MIFGFRPPFSGQLEYSARKSELLSLSLEMATCGQRDRFAERPVEEIRTSSGRLAVLADSIIQDIQDPLLLQPASLELVTLKKRSSDDLVSKCATLKILLKIVTEIIVISKSFSQLC